jgi:hypothetical protein
MPRIPDAKPRPKKSEIPAVTEPSRVTAAPARKAASKKATAKRK